MQPTDVATIKALRREVAAQVARFVERRRLRQLAAAKLLRVPQPTLSKIMNGRVSDLSLELLIRIAVRAGLPVVVRAGGPVRRFRSVPGSRSKLAAESRQAQVLAVRSLTPEQRLDAFLMHCELVTALHRAGRRGSAGDNGHTPAPRP